MSNPEKARINSTLGNNEWKQWGPYLSERQWGTVREDYSEFGSAWEFFPFEHSHTRTYRWGEDGIGGISDSYQRVCFSLGLWNGKDPIIKERLYGISGNDGKHGEDVKELYYHLESTPTHSYMKFLYKYPQAEYPYQKLQEENFKRSLQDPEYEIVDTGIFNENKYFDVFIEYAKADVNDLLIKITIHNRGAEQADLTVLPTLWFRNSWSWGHKDYKPYLGAVNSKMTDFIHDELGLYHFYIDEATELLFCENETNYEKTFGASNSGNYFKDGINDYVVNNNTDAVNSAQTGTKFSPHYKLTIAGGESKELHFRMADKLHKSPFKDFEKTFNKRIEEADKFYEELQSHIKDEELKTVQRQAYAGLLWSKQFYYFDMHQWLKGDPGQPVPPASRLTGRNSHWVHFEAANIISMPDKWEYPWFAAWDLAFHCIPICRLDPSFAKHQLDMLLKEYYMHPNGQIPAYEWAFGDVNPPVHAWAALRVYEIDREMNNGKGDLEFLERIFHKLLLYFTWWVNRKDSEGNNIFEGGFLGLDNVGVFDRGAPLPQGNRIEQADGTSWMAMFALNMLRMAGILALEKPAYEAMCSKFFEHFLFIASAMNNIGKNEMDLWDPEDEFFYDYLHYPDGRGERVKVRNIAGLIPLFAVETMGIGIVERLPTFSRHVERFIEKRPDLAENVSHWHKTGDNERRMVALLRNHRMKRVLQRMFDEDEFLSDYGIRSLSKCYDKNPYSFNLFGVFHEVKYTPGESQTVGFGGNSNWRGPIWFPVNYLIIESLIKYQRFYGDDFKIELPTGSGNYHTLQESAKLLAERLFKLFKKEKDGNLPIWGEENIFRNEHFKEYLNFHEYFHGDNGKGLGASHQTGWTALVADLIHDFGA